jgi:hypothetical protein
VITRKIIEIRKLKSGYLTVRLEKKIRLLHRVIAMQFIPNPDLKTWVDHINGNRQDYNLSIFFQI